jgi:hypothetical protein
METMQASQLHNRPKLWALIEASTERHSREVLNEIETDEKKKSVDKMQKLMESKKNIFKKLPKLDFENPIISFKRNKKLKAKKSTTPVSKDDLFFDFTTSIPSIQKPSMIVRDDENSLSNYSADITTPILDAPEVFNIENSNTHLNRNTGIFFFNFNH